MDMKYIISGGFLAGYRTYIMSAILVLTALASYATGDADMVHTIQALATGLGLGALRSGVDSAAAK